MGSTHSALLDHVEEARNGYAAAAAAAEAAGESQRKRSRSWSRTWTGRSRAEGRKSKEVAAPTTMTHTKSSSSGGSRPVTPNNKTPSWKKFSISGGLSGTHAGLASFSPERTSRSEDPPKSPTKPAATTALVSDLQHGSDMRPAGSAAAPPAISLSSIRPRPPSRPLPPPPETAGHVNVMTHPMTSVHDHSSASTNTADQQGLNATPMATTCRPQLTVESRALPPPPPPKLALSQSEGGATTKPRVLPPPNHRFSLTLYGSSTGYNPSSSCFLGISTHFVTDRPILFSQSQRSEIIAYRHISSTAFTASPNRGRRCVVDETC